MDNSNDIKSWFRRELGSKPENQSLVYIVIVVLNLLVFGFYGSFKGYRSYKEKKSLITEYEITIQNLEENIDDVNKYAPYLNDNSGVSAINKAIPINPDNAAFLRDISKAFARNGFFLDNVSLSDRSPTTLIKGTARGRGLIRDVPELVQDLEDLDRIVNITGIRIVPETSTDTIRMNVLLGFEIYKLER